MSRGGDQDEGFNSDRELRLLAAACHRSFDGSALLPDATFGPAEWERFLRLASFHRVEGLAWRGMSSAGIELPERVRNALGERAQAVAARNLEMLAKYVELRDRFAGADVPILFVKGLTLAALAFGDIAAKSSADIDILVRPDDIERAGAIVEAAGFGFAMPVAAYRPRLAEWHRLSKESSWHDPVTGIGIDLHSRLADNRALIPGIGMSSAARPVEVAQGVSLPTLPRGELAAFLAVHGSSSAWFRLKWATDFAALVEREHRGSIADIYARMQAVGAGRAADQALLVADRLFGTLAGEPDLRRELRRSWPARRLESVAWRMMRCGSEPAEPTEVAFGTAPIHFSQLLIRSDPHFLAAEMARVARTGLIRLQFRS